MVPAADGAELEAGLLAQRLTVLRRSRLPGRVLEQRMVQRSVVRPVLAPDAETHRGGDLVAEGGQRPALRLRVVAQIRQRLVGSDRRVAAGDVKTDPDDRDAIAVGR